VVDSQVGTGLERELDALVPRWIVAAWPFTHPRYIGRDLSWAQWLALPDPDPDPDPDPHPDPHPDPDPDPEPEPDPPGR
jgi:hypothetical protein